MNARIELAAQPPCLQAGMPGDVYHGIRAMSASGLKVLARSPAHYFGQYIDPNRPAEKRTSSLTAGTLAHCVLLEPSEFDRRYATLPSDAPRRPSVTQRKAKKPSPETQEAIAWWDDFESSIEGREIVEPDALSTAVAQATNVRRLPEIANLMRDGEAEASAFWVDEQTGELCKCRPDWTSPAGDGVILVDGKTCQDASPEGFAKTVWRFRYDLQAAWYSDGYQRATGKRVHAFVFAAVEADWPHAAAAYVLGDDVLDRARGTYRELLDRYAECRRTGIWPGYQTEIQPLSLPAWAR